MNQNEPKKIVRTFALASFLHDMGSDMVYAVWPLFVTSVLGANMAVLGLIDGVGDAVVSLSQAASGYISDRIRRRKVFIWAGYFLGALSKIGYGFSPFWQWLIPFRALDRAGKMRGAPRNAMIAEASTRENRAKHFGILRAMDNLGAVFGIILAIFLVDWLGYRNLFLLASLPSLIAAGLVFFTIKEPKSDTLHIYKGLSLKDLSGNFRIFLLLSALFALASFSYSFLLIYAKQFGFKASTIPFLYLIFNATASAISLYFGKLADKIGRKPVLMISYAFWIITCVAFIFFHNYWFIVFAFVLYGLHVGALEPVQKAFVSELAPADYKASTLGAYEMVTGFFALPASLIAGILWDSVSIATPFYVSLGLTVLSMTLLLFVKES